MALDIPMLKNEQITSRLDMMISQLEECKTIVENIPDEALQALGDAQLLKLGLGLGTLLRDINQYKELLTLISQFPTDGETSHT